MTPLVAIMLALTTWGWSAALDARATDYTVTMKQAQDTRYLMTRLDCWDSCPPCRMVEAEFKAAGVALSFVKTDKQHVSEYPVAHYVSPGGVPVQEAGSTNIIKRLKSGGLRFSGTTAKPVLEVRMWSGK